MAIVKRPPAAVQNTKSVDDFVHSLLEHSEKLDVDMQRLIQLRKIY